MRQEAEGQRRETEMRGIRGIDASCECTTLFRAAFTRSGPFQNSVCEVIMKPWRLYDQNTKLISPIISS